MSGCVGKPCLDGYATGDKRPAMNIKAKCRRQELGRNMANETLVYDSQKRKDEEKRK
jgi:hypothetical protein